MTMRDRLIQLLDDKKRVELYFGDSGNCYLADLIGVGEDYVEFNALNEEEDPVAHNIMPLDLLVGITVWSSDLDREKLERLV